VSLGQPRTSADLDEHAALTALVYCAVVAVLAAAAAGSLIVRSDDAHFEHSLGPRRGTGHCLLRLISGT
jgi:hypothetical protein